MQILAVKKHQKMPLTLLKLHFPVTRELQVFFSVLFCIRNGRSEKLFVEKKTVFITNRSHSCLRQAGIISERLRAVPTILYIP